MVNIRFDYQKLRRTLTFYIFFITILQIFLIFFVSYLQFITNRELKIVGYFFIFQNIYTMTMFLSQIILIVLSIKSRFAALNFLLKSKTCIDIHQLKAVSKIHLALTDIIEAMNKSYCAVTLFIFAGVFGFFNLFLFSLRIMIQFFNLECFIIFTGKVLINAYSFVTTMFVIFVSSKASNEAKKTLRVLYELSQKSKFDTDWDAQFLSMVRQIDCSVTKFSCGFFTYDWQLFFKAS